MNLNSMSDGQIIAMLCQRIKSVRIEQKLSQIDLAERSGLGIATIKRIEMGESITLQTLISTLRALDKLDQINYFLANHKVNASQPKRIRKSSYTTLKKDKTSSSQDEKNSHTLGWYLTAASHKMYWKNKE